MIKLWLDDERPTPKGYDLTATNPQEFTKILREQGIPDFISFDWYLGVGQSNGSELIDWIIARHKESVLEFPKGFHFNVHSSDRKMNVEMYRKLQNYLDEIGHDK